jgi:hypothetical protein
VHVVEPVCAGARTDKAAQHPHARAACVVRTWPLTRARRLRLLLNVRLIRLIRTMSRARMRSAAMIQEALLKIYARGVISYFISTARRERAETEANQQCHFKSSRWHIELLDTDSCRGTVPMEPPMSNSSMRHPDPDLEIDDTRMILQVGHQKSVRC